MTNIKSEWSSSRHDADSSAWADAGYGDGDLTPEPEPERPRLTEDELWFTNMPGRILAGLVTQEEFDRFQAVKAGA